MVKFRAFFRLLLCLAVCFAAGGIGGLFTGSVNSDWYRSLVMPSFSPPDWLFGPVWSSLYLLMGVAVFFVWQKGWGHQAVRTAMIIFGVQLFLNAAWSPLFFGLQSPFLALVDIVLLWMMIILTVLYFREVSVLAAGLMVPYLLWVSFALMLNGAIVNLNQFWPSQGL